jgi:hypothetical protein
MSRRITRPRMNMTSRPVNATLIHSSMDRFQTPNSVPFETVLKKYSDYHASTERPV